MLRACCVEQTTPQPFTPTLQIDAELKPSEVSRTLLRQVEMLYPFGTDNERPVACPLTFFNRHSSDKVIITIYDRQTSWGTI